MRWHQALIAVVALPLSFFAWRDAAIGYWRENGVSSPAIARIDPRILLETTDHRLILYGKASPAEAKTIAIRAQAVLRSSPLEPVAIRDMALALEMMGRRDPKPLLLLSERISRRDPPTQNALVRISANEGAYGPTILHLDRLLSVTPRASSAFHRGLIALAGDQRAQGPLSAYGNRSWFLPMLQKAIKISDTPDTVAALLMKTRGLSEGERTALLQHMINRFLADRRYSAARAFAVDFGRVSDTQLTNFNVVERTSDLSLGALAWQFVSDGAVQASLTPGHGVDVQVAPGSVGLAMTRLTLLKPGRYQFKQSLEPDSSATGFVVQWELSCPGLKDEPRIWMQQFPLGDRQQTFLSEVQLPGNCDAQSWRMKVLADAVQMPVSFRVSGLALKAL